MRVAATCRCDRPLPMTDGCQKCGKPMQPPVVYHPRGTEPDELARRARVAAYKAKSRARRNDRRR